jgi:hypothetical protein
VNGSWSGANKAGGRMRGSGAAALLAVVVALAAPTHAEAAQPPVGLGTAAAFVVLGGATVTNTGPSVLSGDLGVSPGTAISGFPPGTVLGTRYAADAVAGQAQADLTLAYNDAAGRTPATSVSANLGGRTLTSGVYRSASALGLTGVLTLDAQGDPNAVFIFQAGSTLITASGSRVSLIGGAQACNVFWQVGSSATLGTNAIFRGNVLALTSITITTGATVEGRLLARNGAVTLDDNTITRPRCASASVTVPSGPTTPGTPSAPSGPTTTTPSAGAPTPAGPATTATPGTSVAPATPGTRGAWFSVHPAARGSARRRHVVGSSSPLRHGKGRTSSGPVTRSFPSCAA